MNRSQWHQLLLDEGAQFCNNDDNFVNSFGDNNPADNAFVTPLLYQSVLSVSGADSNKFLQGQLTCDVNSCTTEQSILGAACNPQGRIYCSFRLINNVSISEPGYLLRMRSNILKTSHETLHKYSVFFKTTLEDASDQWLGLGVWGDNAEQLITNTFELSEAPQQAGQAVSGKASIIVRLPGQQPRFECWIQADSIADSWQSLCASATPNSNHPWLLEDIRLGIAEISLPIESTFNPHMVNFQKVDAISFSKGCYTGQEIVARTHYKGKSKRHMLHFSLTGNELLKPGDELQAPDTGKTIATVVSAAQSDLPGDSTQSALLVVSADLDNSAPLYLKHGEQKIKATVCPLPYSLDEE